MPDLVTHRYKPGCGRVPRVLEAATQDRAKIVWYEV
jgi:hypothetical protein